VADQAPEGGTVLVQDLHLSLLGRLLAERRPDLATAHFSHTPFCWPDGLAVLPLAARRQLLAGLAGHGACGFHSPRWERAFLACCDEADVPAPETFVAPAAADPGDVLGVARGEACAARLAELTALAAGRQVITRVDRMELSKNLVRGFQAFGVLLERRPDLVERVLFLACCYPSREGLAEYAAYKDAVLAEVARLRERFGPVVELLDQDDYPRSVAALRLADVVLVNPVRDGLNIVAKEAAIVGERDPVLCLSPEAGAWDELGDAGAVATPPFDLVATSAALETALGMTADERAARAATLRAAATAVTAEAWLEAQVKAAARPGG
jgi:trehalose 6-phosphate synthase